MITSTFATMYFKVICLTTTWSPGLTVVSHKKLLQSTPGKLLTAFKGKVAELEIKTQLFFSLDPSNDFRTLGLCSNNGKSCFDKF